MARACSPSSDRSGRGGPSVRGSATPLFNRRGNRVRNDEAEAPCLVVEPLAPARATEAVAEDAQPVPRSRLGPFDGEEVHRRSELVLAVAGQRALRGGLAETSVRLARPAREHPALRAETAKSRLHAPFDPIESHLLEHVCQRGSCVAT